MEKAIKAQFQLNVPGLTLERFRKYRPHSVLTALGHQDRQRQHRHEENTPTNEETERVTDDHFFPESIAQRTHECFFTAVSRDEFNTIHGKLYSDQTGKFPIPSAAGNNYVMICYAYDLNAILATAYRSKHRNDMVQAFQHIYHRLSEAGTAPCLPILENECPAQVKTFITQQQSKYQLVPPHDHRRNAAERAIRTFKNHFTAALCGVDPDYPMHQWDQLLPQAEVTLNVMHASRLKARNSAWTMLHSVYNYNQTPIGPAG
jgi:hypothetical protein